MVSSSSHRGCAAAPQPGYDREGWPLLIAAVLPLLAANAGCAEEGSVGAYRLELYDRPVQCAAEQNECTDAAGEAVPPERLRGTANVGRLASRFSPDGIYVYLEFRRANGVIGLLELDIPAPQASRSARAQPRLHLLELQGEQVVFRSARALGRVELPLEPECLCQDGRLELLFTDPGPDGVQGSPDDRVRRLSRAQFSRTGSFCRSPALLDV
ncbi:MAG: hypothetical protein FJ125_15720, partial [Deltaproteobacteria bacterium]|nr:hypothetical protein [Deltaproteobacteria bacterium]